jgi:hypothetical protein
MVQVLNLAQVDVEVGLQCISRLYCIPVFYVFLLTMELSRHLFSQLS